MKYVGDGKFVPDDADDFDEIVMYDFIDDEYRAHVDLSSPEWKARLAEMDKDPAFLADIERERKFQRNMQGIYGPNWMEHARC